MKQEKRIVVRGGGDLATGTIHRLWSAGLRVLVLEAEHPAAIRRQVSLCEAVYEGETTVEGLRAVRVASLAEADAVWAQNAVPVWWPEGRVPGCGKACRAGGCHHCQEKSRNHAGYGSADHCPRPRLCGRAGCGRGGGDQARPQTGPHHPGRLCCAELRCAGRHRRLWGRAGHPFARAGVFRNRRAIADFVEAGETIALLETPEGETVPVTTQISGILRGLLRDGYPVAKGFKVADVDPRREELENCFLISDKARCIAGSVLELVAAELWK